MIAAPVSAGGTEPGLQAVWFPSLPQIHGYQQKALAPGLNILMFPV
jgi:hypothetical protein